MMDDVPPSERPSQSQAYELVVVHDQDVHGSHVCSERNQRAAMDALVLPAEFLNFPLTGCRPLSKTTIRWLISTGERRERRRPFQEQVCNQPIHHIFNW
jgi:hypothetical protein